VSGRTQIRLSGGELRGRVLSGPPRARPTEARVREALFSIWQQVVPGARFLDLFAASGAVGLEALSRGAAEIWMIDSDPRAVRCIEENCQRLEVDNAHWQRVSLPGGLSSLAERVGAFDLIFADPPYAFADYERLLAASAALLRADGVLAIEHSARGRLPERVGALVRTDERRWGETAISFYRRGVEVVGQPPR